MAWNTHSPLSPMAWRIFPLSAHEMVNALEMPFKTRRTKGNVRL